MRPNTETDFYCERDPGCRPLCHTEFCTKETCRETVNAPGYVPLHKKLEAYRSLVTAAWGVMNAYNIVSEKVGRDYVGELAKALQDCDATGPRK